MGVKNEQNNIMIHNILKCHNKTIFHTKNLIKNIRQVLTLAAQILKLE